MLTREILNGYLKLKENKEQIEEEIREFYETCIQSTLITDAPKNPQITDVTATLAEKAEKMHVNLAYAKREMAVSFDIIVNAIADLDTNLRLVIYYKYIRGLNGKEIAEAMSYHESRIWQFHGDALKILFKKKIMENYLEL